MQFLKEIKGSEANKVNKDVLRGIYTSIESILLTLPHAKVYIPPRTINEYQQTKFEGTLFIIKKSQEPNYMIIILNQLGLDNFTESIYLEMELQTRGKSVTYESQDGNEKMIVFESVVNSVDFSDQIIEIKALLKKPKQELESQQLKKNQQIKSFRNQILSSPFFSTTKSFLSIIRTIAIIYLENLKQKRKRKKGKKKRKKGKKTKRQKRKKRKKRKKEKKEKRKKGKEGKKIKTSLSQIPDNSLNNFFSNKNEPNQIGTDSRNTKINGNSNSKNGKKIDNKKHTNNNLRQSNQIEENSFGMNIITPSMFKQQGPRISDPDPFFANIEIEKSNNNKQTNSSQKPTNQNTSDKEIINNKNTHILQNRKPKNFRQKQNLNKPNKVKHNNTNNNIIKTQKQRPVVLTKKALKNALIKLANNDKFLDLLLETLNEN